MNAEWIRRSAVALFFTALALVGLLTVGDYTGSYDEIVEQSILESNRKEYAIALEKTGISWANGLEPDVLPISQSIERDHGISAFYLFTPLFLVTNGSEWARFTLWSAMTWAWFMIGVWSLYCLARHLNLSRMLGCLAALLLYLSPRFFAEGHYNNKDMVLLCQMLLCLWQGSRFLDKPLFWRGLLFSLCGAMACNTKIVGALAWGVMGLAAVGKVTLERKWNLQKLGVAVSCILCFGIFYFLLTPAMWSNPTGFIQYLLKNAANFTRWTGTLYFRGASFQIPEQPLPAYYLAYMILVTLPLYTLPLCVLGQVAAIRRACVEKKDFFLRMDGWLSICATLCWIVPLAAYTIMRPVVYNGWRHFYFAFAGLAVMGAYGLKTLWELCAKKRWTRNLCAVGLGLCFLATAAGMALNHPYQGAYYNVVAGRATMETDYWNSGGTGALKQLASNQERNTTLPMEVGCYFFDVQNARFKLNDQLKKSITTTILDDSPYLYYIENYVQVYGIEAPKNYHVLFPVYSYGRLIGTMYERD